MVPHTLALPLSPACLPLHLYLSSHHNQNHLSILTPDESLSWQSLAEWSLLPCVIDWMVSPPSPKVSTSWSLEPVNVILFGKRHNLRILRWASWLNDPNSMTGVLRGNTQRKDRHVGAGVMKMGAEIRVMGLPVKEFRFFWILEESGNTLTMFVSVSPHSPAPSSYVEALTLNMMAFWSGAFGD